MGLPEPTVTIPEGTVQEPMVSTPEQEKYVETVEVTPETE